MNEWECDEDINRLIRCMLLDFVPERITVGQLSYTAMQMCDAIKELQKRTQLPEFKAHEQ